MGIEETSPFNSSRPSLPPKPQVPPKPGLRGGGGQMARHKSLPSFPKDSSLSQSEVPLSFSTRVKPRLAPKPRRWKTLPQQESISPATEKEGVSIATLLKSPDGCNSGEPASNKHESRLWSGDSGSNRDSPFSETQPGCASSCPSMCPSNSDPHPAAKLQYNTDLDSRPITSLSAPGRSARVPPKIPLSARPLPKEPLLISIRDTKEQPDVPEGVYIEIDASPSDVDDHCTAAVLCSGRLGFPVSPVGGLGAADRLSHSNKHRFIPPVPAKPLPTLKSQSTTKGKESRKNNDGLLSSILAELKEKLPSSCEEIKSGTEPHTRKWMNGKTQSVLCKKTPTNEMALSSSMKRKLLLAECKSFSFKSKNSIQDPQEVNNQIPTVLANLVRNPGADVDVKEKPSDEVHDLSSPVTPLNIQDSLEQEDYMLHQEYDGQDPRSTPLNVMRRIAVGRRHKSLKRFWQEQSIVLDSGVLSQLSKQQLLLQESMYEVVTTEQSYLESLNVAVNVFMESPALKQALAPRDLKSLFSSLGRIREISHNFLESLRERWRKILSLMCVRSSAFMQAHTLPPTSTTYATCLIRSRPCITLGRRTLRLRKFSSSYRKTLAATVCHSSHS
ncbi:hypothetical protein GJAV_G00071320 [Gymnothorax javanicus]|nr:hypothetical protein GJAV_G00071320 [Gymnothorax javanicus]